MKKLLKRKRRILVRMGLWGGCILVILITGLIWFPDEAEGLGIPGALYYTVRLFLLENDLPHFPKALPLILIYFLAPLVSISLLGSAMTYLFQFSPGLRTRWWTDHVIICGMGRTGKLLAGILKKDRVSVVGVDLSTGNELREWASENRVPMVYGNFLSHRVMERAGLTGARAVIFASGDDLANLEGGVGAYDLIQAGAEDIRLLWVHIADDRLADTARTALLTKGNVGIRIFDTYRIAAEKMITTCFTPQCRKGIREIILMGFGKFGQDLMEVLIQNAGPDEKWRIRVVDSQDRTNDVLNLAEEIGIRERVSFIRADIKDLRLTSEKGKAFFICTDDDIKNLAAALLLSSRTNHGHIYVRMSQWPMPAMNHHLKGSRGITFVNINDMVIGGIRELPGIFRSASLSDLKRTAEHGLSSEDGSGKDDCICP